MPDTNPTVPLLTRHRHEIATLYDRAFREFGTMALWNIRQQEDPTVADALAITRALRTEGNMAARAMAEQIESLARADK